MLTVLSYPKLRGQLNMFDVHAGTYSDVILQLEEILKQAKTGRQSQ